MMEPPDWVSIYFGPDFQVEETTRFAFNALIRKWDYVSTAKRELEAYWPFDLKELSDDEQVRLLIAYHRVHYKDKGCRKHPDDLFSLRGTEHFSKLRGDGIIKIDGVNITLLASSKKDRTGYVKVPVEGHPATDSEGHVYFHRLLAEVKIGRFLRKREYVHHRDYDPLNNDPDNLEVMTFVQHTKRHAAEERGHIRVRCNGCGRKIKMTMTKYVRDVLDRRKRTWHHNRRCLNKARRPKRKHNKVHCGRKALSIPMVCEFCSETVMKEARRMRFQQKKGQTQFFCDKACSTKHKHLMGIMRKDVIKSAASG